MAKSLDLAAIIGGAAAMSAGGMRVSRSSIVVGAYNEQSHRPAASPAAAVIVKPARQPVLHGATRPMIDDGDVHERVRVRGHCAKKWR